MCSSLYVHRAGACSDVPRNVRRADHYEREQQESRDQNYRAVGAHRARFGIAQLRDW
jgi:hypothetical protein